MEDGRYGLDATFQGATGFERVESYRDVLEDADVRFSFRQEFGGSWTLRFGPLEPAQVSAAMAAFVR
jgi:hypothetical protein